MRHLKVVSGEVAHLFLQKGELKQLKEIAKLYLVAHKGNETKATELAKAIMEINY